MAVSTVTNRVEYQGNGSSAVFSFPYQVQAQNHISVFVYNSSVVVGGIITPQVLNTDYVVSGTANSQGIYPNGFNVVMNSSPNAQAVIVMFRSSVITNSFLVGQNGTIPSSALNQELDYLTLLAQREQDIATRSVRLQDGHFGTFDTALPANIRQSAGKRLIVNANANGWTFDETLGAYIANTLIYAQTNSSITSVPGSAAGFVMTSNGSSAPTWQQLVITPGSGAISAASITGILGVGNGGTGSGSSFTAGAIIFAGPGGSYAADPNDLFWNATNNRLGIGTIVPSTSLSVFANSSFVAPPTGTVVHVVGVDASDTRIAIDTHGSSAINHASGLLFRRSKGTAAAPTAVVADNTLGFVGAFGYGATGFGAVTAVGISMKASQDWTDTNQGAYFEFKVNPNSSAVSVTRLKIDQDGSLFFSKYATPSNGVLFTGSGGVLVAEFPLSVTNGGTGTSTSYIKTGLIYASSATQFGTIPSAAAGFLLTANGSSPPSFAAFAATNVNSGIFSVAVGGTGTGTSYIQYGILFASSALQIANTAAGGTDQPLIGNAGAAPSFKPLNLVSNSSVTGILATPNGGTGVAGPYVQYGIIYASSATQMATVPSAASGLFLQSNGSSAPSFQAVAVTNNVATLSANTTLTTANNDVIVNSSLYTVIVYPAVGNAGREITFKKGDVNTAGVVTIMGSSCSIDGTSLIMGLQYEAATLFSDNANWQIKHRITPTVSVTAAACSSLITGALTQMIFQTEIQDTHAAYSAGQFIVPFGGDGKYQISCAASMGFTAVNNDVGQLSIFKNSSIIATNQANAGTAWSTHSPLVTIIYPLIGGDSVVVKALNQNTSPVFGGGSSNVYFNITRVGL